MFGDKGRIKQVLVNILSNALKFTQDRGQIKILVCINECQESLHEEKIEEMEHPESSIVQKEDEEPIAVREVD